MNKVTISKRRIACIASIIVTVILFMQLYAITAWSANDANMGPTIVILQFSDDSDSDWAVDDIYSRLREFIPDDPYIVDRLTIRKSSDPNVIENLDADIVIYVSHGGPLGIVTGKCLTSWMQLADIIEKSKAPIHLFTTCESKSIVKYGSSDSNKILYTVLGSRPAEVSDIEVISTALLALGVDSSYVDTYRTHELTKAKEQIQNGGAVHIMSFSEVILDTISEIYDEDTSQTIYHDPSDPFPPEIPENSTYDSDQIVVRFNCTYTYDVGNYTSLSARIRDIVENYFREYTLFDGTSGNRAIENLMITCVEQYYCNATYWTYGASGTLENLLDSYQLDPTLSTFYYDALELTEIGWYYSDTELIGISYSGTMQLGGMNTPYTSIELQIIASADGSGEIQSVFIDQTCVGGLYVDTTYTGSVADSITGRNTGRSGSVFVDPLISTDYEYIADWPGHPYTGGSNSVGQLQSIDDYLTVLSIPEDQGWHGPCFVNLLPSSFRLQDLSTFRANMSLIHNNNAGRTTCTIVGLYDENRKPVLALVLVDDYNYGVAQKVHTIYYREDGTYVGYSSNLIYDDFQGVLKITYDSVGGLYGCLPGLSRSNLCNPFEISWDRLVKYLVIESSRYYEDPEHDERIYDISVESTHSEYTIYHENCQSTDNFINSTALGWGNLSNGTIEAPSGESYIRVSNVAAESASDWSFRKSHFLNAVSGAGCDYQIKIVAHYGSGTDAGQDVYLNGHSKTDFSDVRFVSSDGYTFLNYWRESLIVGSKAEFWVKINEDLGHARVIYVDYGNSAAESMSDGEATFLFFDDFNNAGIDTNKWDTYGTCSEAGGYATLTTSKSTSAAHACIRSDSTFNFQNTAFASRFQYDQWGSREWGISMADSDNIPLCYQTSAPTQAYDHYIDTDGNGYDEYTNWVSISLDTFIHRECMMTTTGTTWTCDSSEHTYSAKTMPAATGKLFLGFYLYGYSGSHNVAVTELDFDWVYVRKCLCPDSQIHGGWGTEESSGGWHGPNFIQVLDRPFRLSQLTDFSIEGEILCDSNEEGRIQVGLFDDLKQCVLMLSLGGYGTSPGQTYFSTYYYPEGASNESQFSENSGYSSGWNARLWREDGLVGGAIFSEIDGEPIAQPWNVANDSRVIKYLAIIPSRIGSTPIPEMRIHGIQLIAAIDSSQHTVVFVENCRDTDNNPDLDNFYSLPGFDWSTPSDGNIYSSSNGYLYPSIPTGPSVWHGPNYFHILERPFRLCNLTDFMVTGELIQSSNKMGSMYVALFDENQKAVMYIYWADAWSGSSLAYFHVAYYPEEGEARYDSTGTTSYSFTRTGRMWYDDGNIKYEIEGIEAGNLGPVSNPDRIIKYIAIRPERYYNVAMIDLRIHGIVLASDYRPSDDYYRFIDGCTDANEFPKDLNFGWGVITDGDLVVPSGTSYMTYANMATGPSGWHGPNFVYTLPADIPLRNITNYEVTAELVQSSATLGKMDVALFDENMQIVMDICWGDSWVGSMKGYHYLTYYFEGGGSVTAPSDYIYTSFLRTGRLWYENGTIKYEHEGNQTGVLGVVDNPDRIIKYIVIRPSRSGNYAMVDLRIHETRLETNCHMFSKPAYGFIEDCKNVYNLPKDLDFGWGVITDGSLVTPSEADYVAPTSMATGSGGWHGPNFVHVLNQPLRLHELSDFAVTGEMVQSANTLGKMDVALFDENKQLVMNIGWYDAWYELIQGSFYVTYYPEGGSSSGASVGYFDTSFVRTGRMWYEDGNIKYEIEQPQGVLSGDLGPVSNPYRLIKYIVVRPSRSDFWPLVDMRIRQISLTSGFRVPTEQSVDCPVPVQTAQQVKSDGTIEGANDNLVNKYMNIGLICPAENLMSDVDSWWTFPWPVLHVRIDATTSEGFAFKYQVARDIIGNTQVEESSLETNSPDDPLGNEGYLQALVEDVVASWWLERILYECLLTEGIITSVACLAAEFIPAAVPIAAALVLVYIGLFVAYMCVMMESICQLTDNAFDRFWMITFLGLTVLIGIVCLDFILVGAVMYFSGAFAGITGSILANLLGGMGDMSLIFLCFKVLLLLWVFVCAFTVFTFTALGYI